MHEYSHCLLSFLRAASIRGIDSSWPWSCCVQVASYSYLSEHGCNWCICTIAGLAFGEVAGKCHSSYQVRGRQTYLQFYLQPPSHTLHTLLEIPRAFVVSQHASFSVQVPIIRATLLFPELELINYKVQFNSTSKHLWSVYHALVSVLSLGYKYKISTHQNLVKAPSPPHHA